jgi:antitoxin YefM
MSSKALSQPLKRLHMGTENRTTAWTLEYVMDAISYSTARANLASTMDRVCEDHEPLIITRNGQRSVVMLSLEDYKALEETAYLLRSPTNARRLLSAMRQLETGEGKARELAE